MNRFLLNKEIIRLQDMNIYCEYKVDDKPALIFIHGFVSSVSTFREIIPLLADKFSTIALDLPGFGNSEKCTSFVYTYENYARLIAACLDYFQLEKASIAGHSMGGQIALNTTKLVPERVDKLVLLASSGYLNKAKVWQRYASYLPFSDKVAKRIVHRKTVPDYLRNVFYDASLITQELIDAYGKPLDDQNFYKAMLRLLRYREGDLPSEHLKQIGTPALLIWGKDDRVVPYEIGLRLSKDLPNAKLISYAKTGHLLTVEKPVNVSQNMLRFLEGAF